TYAHRRTREDLQMAIRYFEKAIEEDRNYALAYAGLVDAYGSITTRGYLAPADIRPKLDAAVRKALALDDTLAEAHAAACIPNVAFAPFNFSRCDREARRAIE